MKKAWPYILIAAVILLLVLVIRSSNTASQRVFDNRVTFRQYDEIPYGTAVAKRLLPELFPKANIYYDKNYPGFWDSIQLSSYNQAVILISRDFEATQYELERLMDFVNNGNYVFLVTRSFSGDARRMFRFTYSQDFFSEMAEGVDSMWMQLDTSVYEPRASFVFPGKRYESWFVDVDSSFTQVLGRDRYERPNFIRINKGEGAIFIHTSPMAFSNYFILHKNNYKYYESVMSVLPDNIDNILWNDYFLDRKPADENRSNWMRVLMQYDAFKWGLITAMLALVLYVFLGSRRTQRMIPPHAKPNNDSLDFVKTMGRLYHERKDHLNLAHKMSIYFLEHVRSSFKLSTHQLDDEFIRSLHFKSGYPEDQLEPIVSFIIKLRENAAVTEQELLAFHRRLELFYQNT
ncbi:MAG: DUF4350 domain-containing protein [Flavisolibacter sp.]